MKIHVISCSVKFSQTFLDDTENLLYFSLRYFIIPSLFSNCYSMEKLGIISLKLLPPFPGSFDWTLSSNFPKTFTELR